jgi:hypothetical protein
MRTPLLLTLVSIFAAFAFIGIVSAKDRKSTPSAHLTTQKSAVTPARQNDRYRGRYQLRLDQARKIIQ